MQINQHVVKERNLKGKKSQNIKIFTDYSDTIQSIAIVFLIKTGGLYENQSNYGISHFLEHMAFKGTKNFNYLQIARKFDEMGGNFNAYTAKDRTVFFAKVLKDNAKEAIDLLWEIILNSTLPNQELEKERNVILQEIAQDKDSHETHIFDLYYQNAYLNQPIGQNLLGSPDYIMSVSRNELYSYMSEFYHHNNMMIALSGNFDEEILVSYINQKFDQSVDMRPKAFSKSNDYKLPASVYTPSINHSKAEIAQTHMILGYEGVSYNSDQFYAQNLASMILGEGMSSRLFQKVREQRGLAYTISSFTGSYHDTGAIGVYAAANSNDVYEIVQIIRNEISDLSENTAGLESDLEIAKNITLSSTLMALENNAARAEKVASNHLTFGRFITLDEITESIQNVTVDDIVTYFSKIVLQSSPTFVSIGSGVDEKIYNLL